MSLLPNGSDLPASNPTSPPEALSGSSCCDAQPEDARVSVSPPVGKVERMLLLHRGDPAVSPPNWEPLSSAALFDESGKPRPEVVREHFMKEGLLSEADALTIIAMCALIWKDEPNVMRLDDPVVVSGDIHGQFYDLLNLLRIGGDPAHQKYIFLGDYVDRGCFGTEVILLLMCYKICYPTTMVLLRGNHESRHLTAYFNFKREVLYKYSVAVYNAMMSAFDCIPLTCILNNRFLCVHGGLSPELKRISDINAIHRFREPPSSGPMCDLLWADPLDEKEEDPAAPQLFELNTTRGCSYVYSHAAACNFLQENNLTTIIRGHEAQDEGYHLYKKTTKGFPSVICLFSAPNYCDTYDNRAAIVMLDRNVMNMRQFNSSPHPYYLPNFMNAFTWSLPFVAEKLLDMWTSVLHLVDPSEDQLVVVSDTEPAPAAATLDSSSSGADKCAEHIREKIELMSTLSRMFSVPNPSENGEPHLLSPRQSVEAEPQLGASLKSPSRGAGLGFLHAKEEDLANERWPDSPQGGGLETKA